MGVPGYLSKFVLAGAVALSSCANRPDVENYIRFDTVDIVQKIRCELRDALRGQVTAFLERRIERQKTGSEIHDRYSAILETLNSDEEYYADFFSEADQILEKRDAVVVRRFEVAAFAYEFTFDLTENNNFAAGADFIDPFTNGTFKLGVSAANNNERKLLRNFKLLDNFKDLTTSPIMNRFCKKIDDHEYRSYPITGSLRLDETVGTVFTLHTSGGLVGGITGIEVGAGAPKIATVPAMADTMQFTTEFSGTLSPSVEISTVGSDFQLAKANLSGTSKRIDIHKLVLVSAIPPLEDGQDQGKTLVAQRALSELERQRRNENREEVIQNLLND